MGLFIKSRCNQVFQATQLRQPTAPFSNNLQSVDVFLFFLFQKYHETAFLGDHHCSLAESG